MSDQSIDSPTSSGSLLLRTCASKVPPCKCVVQRAFVYSGGAGVRRKTRACACQDVELNSNIVRTVACRSFNIRRGGLLRLEPPIEALLVSSGQSWLSKAGCATCACESRPVAIPVEVNGHFALWGCHLSPHGCPLRSYIQERRSCS